MNSFAKRRLFHAKAGAKGGKRADLEGLFVRSSWEANICRVLNFMKATGEVYSWRYEPREFGFPVKRGTRFYRPDFAVVYSEGADPVYWEVKGLLDSKSVTALTRMGRYFPEVTVLLVDKKKYKEFTSDYGHLPFWEH